MINLAEAFERVDLEFRAGRYIAAWAELDLIVFATKMPYTGIAELFQAWKEAKKAEVIA